MFSMVFGVKVLYIDLEPVFNNEGESKEFGYSFTIDDDALFTSPVSVSGKVFNKTGIVNLSATAAFDCSTSCARCAKEITKQTEIEISHILLTRKDTQNEDDENDDDKCIVVESPRLNLDELVREDIYLSLPARFLCREDCKGLCSICGADLNTETCGCKKPSDPRWQALSQLFDE